MAKANTVLSIPDDCILQHFQDSFFETFSLSGPKFESVNYFRLVDHTKIFRCVNIWALLQPLLKKSHFRFLEIAVA